MSTDEKKLNLTCIKSRYDTQQQLIFKRPIISFDICQFASKMTLFVFATNFDFQNKIIALRSCQYDHFFHLQSYLCIQWNPFVFTTIENESEPIISSMCSFFFCQAINLLDQNWPWSCQCFLSLRFFSHSFLCAYERTNYRSSIFARPSMIIVHMFF